MYNIFIVYKCSKTLLNYKNFSMTDYYYHMHCSHRVGHELADIS